MKVGYFAPFANDPTSYYRVSGVLPFINHPDIQFKDLCGTTQFNWSTYTGLQIYILQRPYSLSHLAQIKLCKDLGIRVIGDYDDNLLEVPEENPCFELYRDVNESCVRCIKELDEIWVTTDSIKRRYSAYNKNIHVIKNAHNDYIHKVENKKPFRENRIATYRGGLSHEHDINSSLEDIANTINNNKDWEFRFIGSSFKDLEALTGDNHTFTLPLPFINFFNYLQEVNSNLFFYPLADSQFNRGKSNISWLESTYAGSAFIGNKKLPEFNHPFIFDLSEDFEGVFKAIKDDMELQRSCNKMSWSYIQDHLLLSHVNNRRIERILNI